MGTTMTSMTLIIFVRVCFLWLLAMALVACQALWTGSIHMRRIHYWIAEISGRQSGIFECGARTSRSPANTGLPMEWLDMPHILEDKVYKSTEGSASSVCPLQSHLSFWVVHKTLES